VTDAAILEHVSRLPHARATFKQLVRELGSRVASRDELENALDRLVDRGQLIEVRSGSFVVTRFSREYAVGRLNMHRDGYGFVIPDHPIEGLRGDVYIPRESAQAAMHGDRVVVRIARIERDGRADGEITKVLRRAHQTVGVVHDGIMRPLREVSGVAAGLRAALNSITRGNRPTVDRATSDEEMFI